MRGQVLAEFQPDHITLYFMPFGITHNSHEPLKWNLAEDPTTLSLLSPFPWGLIAPGAVPKRLVERAKVSVSHQPAQQQSCPSLPHQAASLECSSSKYNFFSAPNRYKPHNPPNPTETSSWWGSIRIPRFHCNFISWRFWKLAHHNINNVIATELT